MMEPGTLEVTTPSDHEVSMTRRFEAPREHVYRAVTTPELLKQWLTGPPGWTLATCEVDLRVGGDFRYLWRGPEGEEMGMGGTFVELDPPGRIVHTEIFDEDWTDGETTVTTLLTEDAGGTTLTLTVRYSSKKARDAALETGMTEGISMSYDRLAEMLTPGAGGDTA